MSPQESDRDPSWAWEESRWRAGVEKIRAGRPLRPARWKGGAQVCVALSFDPDHETSTLRDGSVSPGRLSQGEYGSRVAVPRQGSPAGGSTLMTSAPRSDSSTVAYGPCW